MNQSWLNDLAGKPLQEVIQKGEQRLADAQAALNEARTIFRLCTQQNIPGAALGRLRQRLWTAEKALGLHSRYFSQSGQDRFLHEHIFRDKRGGTFVEIGGYDGWTGSNTLFFEKVMGWQGLMVEASPTYIEHIRSVRSAHVVHAAIDDVDGSDEFIHVTDGLTQMGGLAKHYPEARLQQIQSHPKTVIEKVTVPTLRLDTLLKEHQFHHVDYCYIDVDGAEEAILASVDLSAVDISVFSIERTPSLPNHSVASLLNESGYDLVGVVGADEIFVRRQ